jgi:hypothetical protein
MALNENTPLERLQLDVSPSAKRNLKLYAALAKTSASAALDKILTEQINDISRRGLGEYHADVFNKGDA